MTKQPKPKTKKETTAVTARAQTPEITTKNDLKEVTAAPAVTIEETNESEEKGNNTAYIIGIALFAVATGVVAYVMNKKNW